MKLLNTLMRIRDFEQGSMGSDSGLQSSRRHRSKALDEIYKMNAERSGEMKRDSSLRRFAHPGQGEPKPVRCYAQRSPAVARNYEEVRCGSVVRKNCQDVTAYSHQFWAFLVLHVLELFRDRFEVRKISPGPVHPGRARFTTGQTATRGSSFQQRNSGTRPGLCQN